MFNRLQIDIIIGYSFLCFNFFKLIRDQLITGYVCRLSSFLKTHMSKVLSMNIMEEIKYITQSVILGL